MSRNKYTKIVNPVSEGWVSFYHSSNYVSLSFNVHFDSNGKVDVLDRMERRESKDGSFYIAGFDSNITEQEFNEALLKTLEYVTRRNYNIVISPNI